MADAGGLTPEEVGARIARRVPAGPGIVALSGGADSGLLTWSLRERTDLVAVTVDHGLEASPDLLAAARDIAALAGMRHEVATVHPRSASETDLRAVRLPALEAASRSGWIVTGHTADDLAETVLGNLLRGAGATGLSGIPARRDRYVRPMLDLRREEVREVADRLGIPYVDDPGNLDPAVRRNRLRSETLPSLAATYNPALIDALARTARLSAADDEELSGRASRVPVRRDEEAVLIPAAALSTLPTAIGARVVRRALRMAAGPHGGELRSIAAVLEAAVAGRAATIPGGLQVVREGPWVVVAGPPPPTPAAAVLPRSGEADFGAWRLELGSGGTALPAGSELTIRAHLAGDRLPIEHGSKKVSDLLREHGIPPRLRSRWPVVESAGSICWVVGLRSAPMAPGEPAVKATARREGAWK